MNRASPQYQFMRRAVELILNDLSQEKALPVTPASTVGKGQGKAETAKAEPFSFSIVAEKQGV